MKIVVIGGSGLIGKKLVTKLHERGHEAVAVSPSSSVIAVTGAGLADALVDTDAIRWWGPLLTWAKAPRRKYAHRRLMSNGAPFRLQCFECSLSRSRRDDE
jgi:nucleoside-diphosphate-sugar epimerase